MTQQSEALRLADRLDTYATGDSHQQDIEQAAVELRRLDAALQSPQRPWVGLTVEQQWEIVEWLEHEVSSQVFYAIEAKLKEKNNE